MSEKVNDLIAKVSGLVDELKIQDFELAEDEKGLETQLKDLTKQKADAEKLVKLTEDVTALATELKVKDFTAAEDEAGLKAQLKDLTKQKADAAKGTSGSGTSGGTKKKGTTYVVTEKHSISTKGQVYGPGDELTSDQISGGKAAIDAHVKKGRLKKA